MTVNDEPIAVVPDRERLSSARPRLWELRGAGSRIRLESPNPSNTRPYTSLNIVNPYGIVHLFTDTVDNSVDKLPPAEANNRPLLAVSPFVYILGKSV